jgi:hypothetical protein
MNALTPQAVAKRAIGLCERFCSDLADFWVSTRYGYALQPVRVRSDDAIVCRRAGGHEVRASARLSARGAP